MTPKLVIFDMAGTTVYDGDAVHAALMKALAEVDVHPTRDDVNRVMGIPKPVAIAELLQESNHAAGTDSAAIEAIFQRFEFHMLTHYQTSPDIREIDGAAEVFDILRSAGIQVGLDTGFSRRVALTILDRLQWTIPGMLDILVAGDDVPRGRPFPDQIEQAMRELGVAEPASVAKVGDTPSDLQQGTSAGCGWVVGVCQGSHTRDELVINPHTHLVETVADVPALFGL